jgi:hypothetical protein
VQGGIRFVRTATGVIAMLLIGYAIMILPHAFILGHVLDETLVSTMFMMIYSAIVLVCLWKIVWGKA